MKWKYVAALIAGGVVLLAVFFLILSRVPLKVQVTGGQLEMVRVVEMTVTPRPTTRPSPTPTSALLPVTLDAMEDMAGWDTYGDDASTVTVTATSGITGNAVEIAFELQEWGWLGMSREIEPQMLQGTKGIRFFHQGSGAPNTIEFKVLYAPNEQGQSAIFSVLWPGVTVTEDWEILEVRYDELACWEETPCEPGEVVDAAKVWKIDFAISNKAHLEDTPGAGVVAIDEVQGIR
jgi:hypothetical protein